MVADQTPLSPLVIATSLPPGQSAKPPLVLRTSTDVAFGADRRKVTVPSGAISGERTGAAALARRLLSGGSRRRLRESPNTRTGSRSADDPLLRAPNGLAALASWADA